MQTNCPYCSLDLSIDDSKIPDRAYSIKCPRCQNMVRFLGKGTPPLPPDPSATIALNGAASASQPAPAAAPAITPDLPASASEEMRAQILSKVRQEIATGEPASAGQAVVALPDRSQASAMASTLARLGFSVDTVDDTAEATRLVEQGACALLVTAKIVTGIGVPPSLYQRLNRLNGTARRGVFVILVGDEFKSGDADQAFAACADLVLHSRDLATFDSLLRATLAERTRLYQAFLDARLRFEASGAARTST